MLGEYPYATVSIKADGQSVRGTLLEIVGIGKRYELFTGVVEHTVLGPHPDTAETVLADGRDVCLGQAFPTGEAGIEMMRLSGI